MSNEELDSVRIVARQIAERVKNEPDFKAQVQKDPQATLISAGLPEKYITSFLQEAELTDVAGYKANTTILWTDCLILTIG